MIRESEIMDHALDELSTGCPSGASASPLTPAGQAIRGRVLMRGVATVTDARRIGMRPLFVCAVVAGGILENIGRMRSLTAEAHREITRRYSAIMPGLPDWRVMAGARA